MLKKGDYVGIVSCSDARKEKERENIKTLCKELQNIGLNLIISDYIYSKEGTFSGSGEERAATLMDFYRDSRIKAIFDISGGDMCNEILDKLDYDIIKKGNKMFFGYSDLTAVINAIYSKTGNVSCLYQVRNIIGECAEEQKKRFINSIMCDGSKLFDFSYEFIRGERMSGIILGGNIRCLLKLAGTEFMPDFTDKIIFLESLGGGVERAVACMSQLRQLGIFNKVSGVLLGEFTYMSENNCKPTIEEIILREIGNNNTPIARTRQIGHSPNSKAIIIGKYSKLEKR